MGYLSYYLNKKSCVMIGILLWSCELDMFDSSLVFGFPQLVRYGQRWIVP
jgi:hypothetical protein